MALLRHQKQKKTSPWLWSGCKCCDKENRDILVGLLRDRNKGQRRWPSTCSSFSCWLVVEGGGGFTSITEILSTTYRHGCFLATYIVQVFKKCWLKFFEWRGTWLEWDTVEEIMWPDKGDLKWACSSFLDEFGRKILCRQPLAEESLVWTDLALDSAAGIGAWEGKASDRAGGGEERALVGSLFYVFVSAPFLHLLPNLYAAKNLKDLFIAFYCIGAFLLVGIDFRNLL